MEKRNEEKNGKEIENEEIKEETAEDDMTEEEAKEVVGDVMPNKSIVIFLLAVLGIVGLALVLMTFVL